MTASNLNGRDLDARVARIFGWHQPYLVREDDVSWSHPKNPRIFLEFPPEFSTDPATLDEKLTWLRERGHSTFITQFRADGEWHVAADSWPPSPARVSLSGRCKTIHEATARLVVAVAEARAKEKQP